MRKLVIILLIAISGWQVAQSQNNTNSFRFIWNEANYLFYDTYDLNNVAFESTVPESVILQYAKKSKVIGNVAIVNGSGIIYFKTNPKASDIRMFLEKIGVKEFYVNDTRILTYTLLDKTEIEKITDKKIETERFQSDFNQTGTIKNAEFNIQFFESKIYNMQITDYPRYLYQGYITTYTEALEQFKLQLQDLKMKK